MAQRSLWRMGGPDLMEQRVLPSEALCRWVGEAGRTL